MPALAILLLSGSHDRAHAAFMLAAAAAALGRRVTVFAMNQGARALCADWSQIEDVGRDAVIRRRGAAGLGELRDAAREAGATMLVCDTALKTEALQPHHFAPGVTVAGLAAFLGDTKDAQYLTF